MTAGRKASPRADLKARVIARAAWSAARAARDVWVASDGKRDPCKLINEAFELFERGLRPT